jgi:hypothetical protein
MPERRSMALHGAAAVFEKLMQSAKICKNLQSANTESAWGRDQKGCSTHQAVCE